VGKGTGAIALLFVSKGENQMPRKNQITNQDQDQQKILEAQVSESRKSENQSQESSSVDQRDGI
jgi:hypothetical protein